MSREKTLFEKIGITYREENGLFYPVFSENAMEKEIIHSGKYGHLWIAFMKDNHPSRYRHLFWFGKLREKAAEVNEQAYEMLDSIVADYIKKHPPVDPASTMEMWKLREQARRMAEELVLHDIIYQFH